MRINLVDETEKVELPPTNPPVQINQPVSDTDASVSTSDPKPEPKKTNNSGSVIIVVILIIVVLVIAIASFVAYGKKKTS